MLVLLDRDWGRSKSTPQTKIFSHQCGGHLQLVGGLNPPNPATNRTLPRRVVQHQEPDVDSPIVTQLWFSYHCDQLSADISSTAVVGLANC